MPYDPQRYPDNADGAYYTTRDCVLCHTCHESAPRHFNMSVDGDHMVVSVQPSTQEERDLCAAALESCPMVAIRDDG